MAVLMDYRMPFKVHLIACNNGNSGTSAHGFMLSSTNGEMLHDGRSTYGGFTDVLSRPVEVDTTENWSNASIFTWVGIKRSETGKIRRLIGWLDREHLLWQSDDGKLWWPFGTKIQ